MMKFGLLGEQLGHSMSPALHALLGAYPYELYEVPSDRLGSFLQTTELSGMNVTIPYKKAVLPYCSAVSERAKRCGSVNTLVRRPDGWYGDNTDYAGFCAMLAHAGYSPKGKKGLVLGSGGASVTIQTALCDLGADEVVVISRSGRDNYQDLAKHTDARFVVNTTPVGMYPKPEAKLLDASAFPQCEAVFDLIYNPLRTELLLSAERCGMLSENGLFMLAAQAFDSAEQFLGEALPRVRIGEAWKSLLFRMQNLVLIGMPGCGKTAIGRRLAENTGKVFLDSDDEITKKTGRTPAQIILSDGEAAFREIESEVISALSQQTGIVLACGGGAVLRAENRQALRRNGKIIWLQRNLNQLETAGRPISGRKGVDALYDERRQIYADFADAVIDNNGEIGTAADNVTELLK